MNTTICAISTPTGTGGIAVIRVSGPEALAICGTIWQGKPLSQARSHTAHLGYIIDPARPDDDRTLDQAVATLYRGPHSYTGEDTVELSVHGSKWIQQQLINLLIRQGCQPAQPGEFTRRAFTAGHLDLAQAEAVADIIAARSRAEHRIALTQMRGDVSQQLNALRDKLINLTALLELELDFSDQDIEFADRAQLLDLTDDIHSRLTALADTFDRGAAIKEGIPVAIIGPTNSGKSALLNAILGEERAIVSDIHGTTRDTIEDTIEIGDYMYRLIDTAGIRHTTDIIEQLGIRRSIDAIGRARIILLVIDPQDTRGLDNLANDIIPSLNALTNPARLLILINKSDLNPGQDTIPVPLSRLLTTIAAPHTLHHISAATRQGLDEILTALSPDDTTPDDHRVTITNARHYHALRATADACAEVSRDLRDGLPADLTAQPLRLAIHHLGTITGAITTPDILTTIFTRFCIGK